MGMPEPHFSTLDDDLPRTFRREREAREKEAREREAREQPKDQEGPAVLRATSPSSPAFERPAPDPVTTWPGDGVTVTRFKVPFLHLVGFFMKVALAALPALVMLTIMFWIAGEVLQRYFPWLLKMRILIQFPG
jgi:hypothetical protein